MKRSLMFVLFTVLSLFLIACNGDDKPTDETNTENQEVKEKSSVSDTTLDTGDYVYEIKDIEQVVGKEDMNILAVEVEFTNKSDEPKSPWMAGELFAEQETETTVELLNGALGMFPDDYKPELTEMGDTNVKPGATVDAVIGYEILYPGNPVRLYNFMYDENPLFERVVETEE